MLDRIKAAGRRLFKSVGSFGFGVLRSALGGGMPGAWASDHRTEAERYTGWHYIAITTLAEQGSQATTSVYEDLEKAPANKARRKALRDRLGSRWKSAYGREDGDTEALPETHALVRILKRPNPYQSGAEFTYERIQQLELTGTCLIWNVPNRLGKTVQRYILPTGVAWPVAPSKDLPKGGWRISPESTRNWNLMDSQGFTELGGFYNALGKTIDARQVQVQRSPHPIWRDDGYSPVAAGALWSDTAKQVDESRWAHVRNGIDPSLHFSADKDVELDEAGIERAESRINAKLSGPAKTGSVLVTSGGTKVTKISNTPADMAYEGAFTQFRDAILALHRTTPIAAGITDGGSYAAFYAAIKQYVCLRVQPTLSKIAEHDTEHLAPEFGAGLTIEMEASGIDDPEVLERELQTDIAAGIRRVNEIRSIRGLPPINGPEGERMVGGQPQQLQVVARQEQRTADESTTGLPGVPRLGSQPAQPAVGGQAAAPSASSQGATPENIAASQALNGAQITAAVEVLSGVTAGNVAHLVAVELLVAVGIDRQRAEQMVTAAEALDPPSADPAPEPVLAAKHHRFNGHFEKLMARWKDWP